MQHSGEVKKKVRRISMICLKKMSTRSKEEICKKMDRSMTGKDKVEEKVIVQKRVARK